MKEKVLFILAVLVAFVFGAYAPAQPKLGSVATGESYLATTTSSVDGSATASYVACKSPSGLSGCNLGSVVVVQPATAGYVRLWAATSTASSSYTTNINGTYGLQIALINSGTDAVGTLTFDQVASPGLVVETSADFNGEYVITSKY